MVVLVKVLLTLWVVCTHSVCRSRHSDRSLECFGSTAEPSPLSGLSDETETKKKKKNSSGSRLFLTKCLLYSLREKKIGFKH